MSLEQDLLHIPHFPSHRITRKLDIKTSDGLILKGWQITAKNTKEVRGNVVIVHGIKEYSERYLDFAEELSRNGYQVFSYDLRGHGRSEGERSYFPSIDLMIEDLELSLLNFHSFDNHKPWMAFGQGFGGSLLTRYSITSRHTLSGLILSSAAFKLMPDFPPRLLGAIKASNTFFPRLRIMDFPNEKFSRDPKVIASIKKDLLMPDLKIPARTGYGLLQNMDYIQEHKHRLSIPFLILHGSGDSIYNIEGSREFFGSTPNIPGKQIKIYPVLSYDLLHEPEHFEVERDIIHWLNLMSEKRTPPKIH